MIKPLSIEQAHASNLAPAATVSAPMSFFKHRGINFHSSVDDTEKYAILSLDNEEAFGFVEPQGLQADETTLLLPLRVIDEGQVASAIVRIANELDIPLSMFHWRLNGEDVSFAAAPAQAA